MNNKNEDVYVFPTTFPQRQIWFIHQINKESPAYNIPFAYDINGDLNVAVLENAVTKLSQDMRRFVLFLVKLMTV